MHFNLLQQVYLNNRLIDYIISIGIFLAGIIAIWILKSIILLKVKKILGKISGDFASFLINAVEKAVLPLSYYGIFYLSVQDLSLNASLSKGVKVLGLLLLTIFSVRFIISLASYGLDAYWKNREKDEAKIQSNKMVLTIIKVVIWCIAIVLLMDNLGIKISALVAGLGIGGIAVALASQAVLADLFSYFTIFFDRPFEIGDFIIVGDYLGTVEHIGIKTTRIRSLGGEQLVFSNTDLTNSRVRNYKRMDKRRVVFKLGVTYQTTLNQIKEAPKIIKDIIGKIPDTVFDRAHFSSYGDFSLVIEVVYYVFGSDYNKYMDIQQEINFRIKEEFEKKKIEFAYPTQTVFLSK